MRAKGCVPDRVEWFAHVNHTQSPACHTFLQGYFDGDQAVMMRRVSQETAEVRANIVTLHVRPQSSNRAVIGAVHRAFAALRSVLSWTLPSKAMTERRYDVPFKARSPASLIQWMKI